MTPHRITRQQIACELVVRRDAARARDAGVDAVAARAPYTYAEIARWNRERTLVERLAELDAYTLRAQAVRVEVETCGRLRADAVESLWVRLLTEARFGAQ